MQMEVDSLLAGGFHFGFNAGYGNDDEYRNALLRYTIILAIDLHVLKIK